MSMFFTSVQSASQLSSGVVTALVAQIQRASWPMLCLAHYHPHSIGWTVQIAQYAHYNFYDTNMRAFLTTYGQTRA